MDSTDLMKSMQQWRVVCLMLIMWLHGILLGILLSQLYVLRNLTKQKEPNEKTSARKETE